MKKDRMIELLETMGKRTREGEVVTEEVARKYSHPDYIEAIRSGESVLLLGKPGTGKSIALQYAYNLAVMNLVRQAPPVWIHEAELMRDLTDREKGERRLTEYREHLTIILDDFWQEENWVQVGREGHYAQMQSINLNLYYDLLLNGSGKRKIVASSNNVPSQVVKSDRILRRITETFEKVVRV